MAFKTQQEKDAAIEAARKQLAEAESALVSGRWVPLPAQDYHFITDTGSCTLEAWDERVKDTRRFETFNCFPTREAAQQEADRMLIDRELRAFCKECNAGEEVDWNSVEQP